MVTIKLDESLQDSWQLPLITDYIKRWAEKTPDNIALVGANKEEVYTYKEFDEIITLYALRLKEMGVKKGDIVAVQWLSTPEFFFLTYGCATVGAVISPLDVRLQDHEIIRNMNKIEPVAFFCLGNTPLRDFTQISQAVFENVKSLKHIVEYPLGGAFDNDAEYIKDFSALFSMDALTPLAEDGALVNELKETYASLDKRDPHIIIFTTGTTGFPKAALICNENTLVNNAIFSREVGLWGSASRFLNSMPTSHVAGTCQGPMTAWFVGGTVVTVNIFQPDLVLQFIEKYKATWWGGVPTMFHMIWQMPNYQDADLSSLLYVLYGGSAVDITFLEQMQKMAPSFGTALGMTECAGYFTATPKAIPIQEMAGQVGQVYPELAPVTIREPMKEDGTAGEEVPLGEVGEICVHGPIVFLGYYNDEEATSKAITRDGVLYTGDMGYFHDFGVYRGLKFAGRRKFVIKPKGYLVFPDEVSDFINQHPDVDQALVVGVPHKTHVDGVFAWVKPKAGKDLASDAIKGFCKDMAGYKRPLHVEFWPNDQPFHVNRVGKVDVMAMTEEAVKVVEVLKKEDKWD
ncbi:class I adenylate-forming enzyme family protein [Desulfatibacillum aliphaticivorans]|uniref:class I adenylate-forming enzyme family protein n=1 Tax=Desulfatibacillum aliphaticivorans TaxID=218208 RepID=UPI0004225E48|nr:class I adenylate-forming enzyme family protein [Desulfatibacillum aliphaticivorans]